MKRREFVERVSMGSAALVAGGVLKPNSPPVKAAGKEQHEHGTVDGPLASATVSFGQWQTDPPHDRFPNVSDRTRNHHTLSPLSSSIKQGGSVNFILGGFHHVLIYGPGTQMSDIDTSAANLIIRPGLPPLINDPTNRVYRGLDPSLFPQDRVEVVVLSNPGRYLVVCGVLPHFVDNMHGFINVLP